jgi:UDP-N-acetylmuramoyl-tripeptide--D-alanyl-D-alanine ligase
MIGAILSRTSNCYAVADWIKIHKMAGKVMSVSPSTKFCVLEVSGHEPGIMARSVSIVKPTVGLVTTIGTDHYVNFRSREAVAVEKGVLVEALPRTGTAILNADDPLISAMAKRTRARVVTFGRAPHATIRAINVSSVWPDRLALTVVHGAESVRVRTQFVGDHWTVSVLAAIACAVVCGVDLKTCAETIEEVEPIFGRYSVHLKPNGPAYVLDAFKAPYWTIASGLEFVRSARAPRKTIVFGTISDYSGARSKRYRKLAREALQVADRVVFIGPSAGHVTPLRTGEARDRLFSFETVYQANAFLSARPIDGELIYIKGTIVEHLDRLVLSQIDEVVCWREKCGRPYSCVACRNYREPSSPSFAVDQIASLN